MNPDTATTPPDGSPTPSHDLREVLRVLRRRWRLIVGVVAAMVAIAGAISFLQDPVYQATATLVVQSTTADDLFNPRQDAFGVAERRVATEAEVLKGAPVAARVEEQLGRAPDISVKTSDEADVLQVTARSKDPQEAMDVANAYASAYVDVKREQTIDELLAGSEQVRARVDELQAQIDALDAQIADAPAERQDAVRESLAPRRNALLSQQTGFRETLDKLEVRVALASGGASVVAPATLPSSPVEPQPVRNIALAVVVGLLVGVGIAFLLENLDDRIRGKVDLEKATSGLPVLGLIPSFGDGSPLSLSQAASPAGEAYRTLRTSVQFLGLDRDIHVIQVTSPNQSDGKTTTIANLGLSLASAGARVCLVDADLRRPRLASVFGLDGRRGLTTAMLGHAPLDELLVPIGSAGSTLQLLPAGPVPPNPSELLSSSRVNRVLDELTERFELVLLDTPPTLPVSDALVASRLADAVLIVGTAGRTTRKSMQRALELLQQVDAPLVGTVLNRAEQGDPYGDGYGYGYGYGDSYTADPEPRERERSRFGWRRSEGVRTPVSVGEST